jgi:RNA-splicing ligase RtcB
MSTEKTYNGKDLLAMGCQHGPVVGKILEIVNATPHTEAQVKALIEAHAPPPVLPLHDTAAPCQFNLTANNEMEQSNLDAVEATMKAVLKTPCVVEGAVMPDACPAGPIGTIPVGGVVATQDAIIPGMHSADICCSLMATVFDNASPQDVLNAAHKSTHFGPGGREIARAVAMPATLAEQVDSLQYPGLRDIARYHLGTQGDGNHFVFVGTLESSGKTVLVTHHGSRGFGARLFKHGKQIAERFRKQLSPDTLPQNAWIPFDTDEGKHYWHALQVVREWTKHNHESLHELTVKAANADVAHRFWNEHNFVFREETDNGSIFWHAKGATPIHNEFMPDTSGVQIVPLNMSEPVLFVQGERNARNRGFAPHGAGRNMSRTKHKKRMAGRSDEEIFKAETENLDVRFYSGNIDISELPSAYKNARSVVADMDQYQLANVVDRVLPFGSIMAGNWQRDVSWKQLRANKRNAKKQAKRRERRNARQNLDPFDDEG